MGTNPSALPVAFLLFTLPDLPATPTPRHGAGRGGWLLALGELRAPCRRTGTGDGITDEWGYSPGGLAGVLSFDVFDAGGGQYWVVTRIFEPFAG